MNNKKVTIITPTYNRLASLKEAIESVRKQSYQNWEHLIIADGSDIRVQSMIKNYKDQRLIYLCTLRTSDWGHSQRNWALRYATGQYLFCLDDDNLICDQYIEKMVNGFSSGKIGYVVCNIDYAGEKILSPKPPFQLGGIDHLNIMVRTELMKKIGGWTHHYEADYIMIKRISEMCEGACINYVLGVYRRLKGESVGNERTKKEGNRYIRLMRKIKQKIYSLMVRF